ncbi:DUF1361 domain-containing protein [Staphylococcus hominis]
MLFLIYDRIPGLKFLNGIGIFVGRFLRFHTVCLFTHLLTITCLMPSI